MENRPLNLSMPLEQRKANIAYHMKEIIYYLGLDTNSPHLKDTPNRVAKMYVDEIFSGLYTLPPKMTEFEDGTDSHGMVFLGGIDVFSTCSHHFKSFRGKAYIAYIPKNKLVGISKLARITDWYARRPQVQEILGKQIADHIMEVLDPEGVAVTIEAQHDCIIVRGAKQSNSVMITTALRGCFLEDKDVEREFENKILQFKSKWA